jgi:hypothetical protein
MKIDCSSANFQRNAMALAIFGMALCITLLLPPISRRIIAYGSLDSAVWLPRLFSLGFLGLAVAGAAGSFLAVRKDCKDTKTLNILVGCLILSVILFESVYFYKFGQKWLNSDDSADLLGAKILSEENAIFSTKWYYGTEFWILYRQPLAILLFKFLDDWNLIRALNIAGQLIFTVAAYIFMMRQTNIKIRFVLLSSCFLIVPLSRQYFWIVNFATYYNLYFIKIFIIIGCFLALMCENRSDRAKTKYFWLLLTVSFWCGLEGIRVLYEIVIPLILTTIVSSHFGLFGSNKEKLCKVCFSVALAALLGYFINSTILYDIFKFHSFSNIRYHELGAKFFDKLGSLVFGDILQFFGYMPQAKILGLRGVPSAVASFLFLGIFASLIRTVHTILCDVNHHAIDDVEVCFLVVYLAVALAFNILFLMTVSIGITQRYLYCALIFVFPFIAMLIDKCAQRTFGPILCSTVLFLLFICAGVRFYYMSIPKSYRYDIHHHDTSLRKPYISWLNSKNLVFGFSSFWNANITTELSGGRIEVASLSDTGTNPSAELRRYKWLSPAKFDDPSYVQRKDQSFLLMTAEEWNARKARPYWASKKPDWQDARYVVFVYPSALAIRTEVLGEKW